MNVKLQNYDLHTWTWAIGVPKDQIIALRCVDYNNNQNQLNLNYIGDAIDVTLKSGSEICNNFIISCDMKNEDFLDTFLIGDDGGVSFSYADNFWFNQIANLFKITFNFPPRIRLEEIDPLPIDIEEGNKLLWRRESWPQNRKLKLKMKGKFLT